MRFPTPTRHAAGSSFAAQLSLLWTAILFASVSKLHDVKVFFIGLLPQHPKDYRQPDNNLTLCIFNRSMQRKARKKHSRFDPACQLR
jgi:hypothetical protein